jgi:hypothetical protein
MLGILAGQEGRGQLEAHTPHQTSPTLTCHCQSPDTASHMGTCLNAYIPHWN